MIVASVSGMLVCRHEAPGYPYEQSCSRGLAGNLLRELVMSGKIGLQPGRWIDL